MRFLEQAQIVPIMTGGVLDVRNQTRTGDYVCMKDFRNLTIVVHFADGQAGDDVKLTVEQATDAAGTGHKAVNVLQTGRIFTKLGAADVTAVGGWTQETQAVADEEYTHADAGEQSGLYVVELSDEDFDLAGGFDWVRCDITGIANTAAKLACGEYILWNPRYSHAPASMPSVIA
jgi:hypothetical protein